MSPMRVGVIGCGNICETYFHWMRHYRALKPLACADLDPARSRAKAAEHGLRSSTVEELLAADDVELVVNLTIPAVHVEVNKAILRAGKHAYSEKPFALNLAEGADVLALASERGLRVGSAPDTFLGGGIQTCRHLIDAGAIGRPISATAFMCGPGPEGWHPSPAFYYTRGGGPMLDMGPYYLTALVNLLGPARRVAGMTAAAKRQRTITSQPLAGQIMPVETPTHVAGTVEFVAGSIATLVMSFDVFGGHHLPIIEIHGTEGSLAVPDPNCFEGEVLLRQAGARTWRRMPSTQPAAGGRGLGVAEMARAIRLGRPHRASGQLAQHVLETMLAFEKSALSGRHVTIRTPAERPAAMPAGLAPGEVD